MGFLFVRGAHRADAQPHATCRRRRRVGQMSVLLGPAAIPRSGAGFNPVAAFDGRFELSEIRLQSIGKVAGAGEYVYWDVPGICLLADSRGELSFFASLM